MFCALCACAVVFIFYVYFSWENGFWKKRGVPFAKPMFFFGSYLDVILGRKHFAQLYMDLYRQFPGAPYIGYFKMNAPVILLRDPEIIKSVLSKDFHNFSHNEFQVNPEYDPIFSTNPFIKRDEEWKTARAQWSSSMTPAKVKAMHAVMVEKADLTIRHLKDFVKSSPKEPLEAREISSNYLTDFVVSALFGLHVDSFLEKDNPFRKITRSFFTSSAWDGFVIVSCILFPWLGKIFKFRFVSEDMHKEFINIAKSIIACRKENSLLKSDVYDLMVKGNQVTLQEAEFELELAGRVFGFLLDGTETSSGALAYVLYELARHPDIQNRLREELDAAAGSDGQIPYEEICNLPYINMVLLETLRLHPPAMSVSRMCSRATTLPPPLPSQKPLAVSTGMVVTIPVLGLHMDPVHFPEPSAFKPERFENPSHHKFSYLPFSEGPRICVGYKLAQAQLKVGIAALVRNFELRVSSKTKDPIELDKNVFIKRAVGGLWINIYERAPNTK